MAGLPPADRGPWASEPCALAGAVTLPGAPFAFSPASSLLVSLGSGSLESHRLYTISDELQLLL